MEIYKKQEYWTVKVYVKIEQQGSQKEGYLGSRVWTLARIIPESDPQKVLDELRAKLEPATKKAIGLK